MAPDHLPRVNSNMFTSCGCLKVSSSHYIRRETVSVLVYSDLFLSGARINDGLAITVVICMHSFT